MNRREFLAAGLALAAVGIAPTPTRDVHVYEVIQGDGDWVLWVASSPNEAIDLHLRHWGDAGEALGVTRLDDTDPIEVDTQTAQGLVTKTCGEWAVEVAQCPVPLVASSVY